MQTNVSYGIESTVFYLKSLLVSFLYHQMVLGFAFGFLAATGIYMLLLAEEPSHIPKILTNPPNVCFEKIAQKQVNGTYQTSYTEFQDNYFKIKILFYTTILAFLLVLGATLLK